MAGQAVKQLHLKAKHEAYAQFAICNLQFDLSHALTPQMQLNLSIYLAHIRTPLILLFLFAFPFYEYYFILFLLQPVKQEDPILCILCALCQSTDIEFSFFACQPKV